MPSRDKQPEPAPDQGQQPPEPDPTPQPSEPAAGTVRLAVLAGPASPDSLVVGDGDTALEVTADGTDVPAEREDEVRAAAKAHGVTIRKVN
jgi:hypothetical protein